MITPDPGTGGVQRLDVAVATAPTATAGTAGDDGLGEALPEALGMPAIVGVASVSAASSSPAAAAAASTPGIADTSASVAAAVSKVSTLPL